MAARNEGRLETTPYLLPAEFERESAQVNLRMPEGLLKAVKERARKRGIPYQRFIRETLERVLQ